MNVRRTHFQRLFMLSGCQALLVACLLMCLGSVAAAQEPEVVVFEGDRGAVSFDHAAHQLELGDCQACHHAGQEPGSCRACHIGAPGIPRSKDALHKSCKGCHLKTSGPIRCDDCHGERSVY